MSHLHGLRRELTAVLILAAFVAVMAVFMAALTQVDVPEPKPPVVILYEVQGGR